MPKEPEGQDAPLVPLTAPPLNHLQLPLPIDEGRAEERLSMRGAPPILPILLSPHADALARRGLARRSGERAAARRARPRLHPHMFRQDS